MSYLDRFNFEDLEAIYHVHNALNVAALENEENLTEKEADKASARRIAIRNKETGAWIRKVIRPYSMKVLDSLTEAMGKKVDTRDASVLRDSIFGEEGELSIGMYKLVTHTARSELLKGTNTDAKNLRYSALVPLILASQKQYQRVDYMEWDNAEGTIVARSDLGRLMRYNSDFGGSDYGESRFGISTKLLLEIRQDSLQIVGGEVCLPEKNHAPLKVGFGKYDDLPKYLKIISQQFWLAHPKYRNEYMILDPLDWDNMP